MLGYSKDPKKLQAAIRYMYLNGTCKIHIANTHVIPFPMYMYMDGSDSNDYVARVEPSDSGGEKLAVGLYNAMFGE